MIKLGLERAARLCDPIPQPWKAIHVAGTNGKGSVCAFLTNALRSQGLKCGTFTSPHLIDRWDCIKVNGSPISLSTFAKLQDQLKHRNKLDDIGATDFELLTASAFQTFTDEDVDVAIVECGMGGKRDATNVLKHKEMAVITRIGLDHQEFLGSDLRQIAAEKCGIFRYNIEVIYDPLNHPDVIREIRYQSWAAETLPVASVKFQSGPYSWIRSAKITGYENYFDKHFGKGSYLSSNASLAYRAAHRFMIRSGFSPDNQLIARSILRTKIPGRMQVVNLKPLIGHKAKALIDGAHNAQAIEQLEKDVISKRREKEPSAWVFALSEQKQLDEMIRPLVKSRDIVAAVEFGPVDGMSWKKPTPSSVIKQYIDALGLHDVQARDFGNNIRNALAWTANQREHGLRSIYIIGSLYLASDVLRMLRDEGVDVHDDGFDPSYSISSPGPYIHPSKEAELDELEYQMRMKEIEDLADSNESHMKEN